MSMFRTLMASMAQDYIPVAPDYPVPPPPGVLPDDYQQVEYIQGTGTQYIDTGIYPDTNKMQYKLKTLVPNGSTDGFIIGSSGDRYQGLNLYNDSWANIWSNYNNSGADNLSSWAVDTDYTIDIVLNNGYVNGTINGNNISGSSYLTDNSYTNYLFRSHFNNEYFYTGRLYYCQIYQNDVLIRDYVPCYRKIDNIIGLYDLVNQVFYTNDGTGTFIKGNDV